MNRRLKQLLAGSTVVAGVLMASAGMAVMFGVIAATMLDGTWNGASFHSYDIAVNGREISDALSQTLLIAVPLLVMLGGAGLIIAGWRACRTTVRSQLSASQTAAALRS